MFVSFEPLDPPATDGQHYFTLAELRAEQDVPASYPDSAVDAEPGAGRAGHRERLRRRVHPSPPHRDHRRGLEGACASRQNVRSPSRAGRRRVRQRWGPVELEHVLIANGVLFGIQFAPGQPLTVTYTHGYETPPARIRRAAMIATRIWTTRGPVDDRATQIAADGATVNLATPGLAGSVTGIPEVDAAIRQHDRRALIA